MKIKPEWVEAGRAAVIDLWAPPNPYRADALGAGGMESNPCLPDPSKCSCILRRAAHRRARGG